MPELPEVNNFKRYFNESSLGKTIERVKVHDDKIIRNMSGVAFADALSGRKIETSLRRGKYLFVQLDNGHDLLLHFGMTGDLNYYTTPEDQGRFERFALHFTDGDILGFDDPRKFARILYLEDRNAYIAEIKLGPDALEITPDYLLDKMKGKKGSIKGFLLNQSILAGVGNLYADEICYRSRLSPALTVNQLTEKEKRLLAEETIEVMTGAAQKAPYYKDYPDDWYWHVWRKEGQSGPEGVGEVVITKVAGRTTYYVKGWQREA
jgi:formamidopyrimidine-DNA glycosylase